LPGSKAWGGLRVGISDIVDLIGTRRREKKNAAKTGLSPFVRL